jgi:hypothetical protein
VIRPEFAQSASEAVRIPLTSHASTASNKFERIPFYTQKRCFEKSGHLVLVCAIEALFEKIWDNCGKNILFRLAFLLARVYVP